jgi:bacteriocin-like protein
MKDNKKPNSIATMSEEELQEINGGMYMLKLYPDIFPEGIPALKCSLNSAVSNPGMIGTNAEMMNSGIMNR